MRLKKIEKNKTLLNGIKCELCELVANDLTSHITRTHCTIDEYKKNFPNAAIRSEKYLCEQSQRIRGDKNPGYQHGGKYSPFSEKYIHGKDKTIHLRVAKTRDENSNNTTKIDYYLKRGLSLEEAQQALAERQTTFSLKKCIKKFGQNKGEQVWKARQEKWQNTLNSKPLEERISINQKKINPDYCISKAEKDIVSKLMSHKYDVKTQQSLADANWIYDIVVGNKIIEYHGDYWHCNPHKYDENYYNKKLKMFAKTKWELDQIKKEHAIAKGYEYFVIWEQDYKQDPQKVINECVCFLMK